VSDFVLEISGVGSAITLEPVGVIDGDGAQTILEALGSLREERTALLELRLDRVTGLTEEAREVLADSDLPVELISRRALSRA
jgi:hypothetical protein